MAAAGGLHARNSDKFVARAQSAADALPQIVTAMRAHPANASVQGNACRALCNITFCTDALRDARTQSAVAAGALPQIVAAMRAHPSAVDAGALLQIVATMRAHSTNPALQTKSCWALCNITAGADVQRDARAQGDAHALYQRSSAGAGMRALCNIAAGADVQADARKQAAADAGALPRIDAAMRAHPAKTANAQN
ncbi:hypothetical protein T492DRAFT_832814 [Pavlovales sp. CCMP2436]|nr:hypothetical protein T492DRAFT_832814 [Pavlovales sp. CCMP2436]